LSLYEITSVEPVNIIITQVKVTCIYVEQSKMVEVADSNISTMTNEEKDTLRKTPE
jgi:hypothetical protein